MDWSLRPECRKMAKRKVDSPTDGGLESECNRLEAEVVVVPEGLKASATLDRPTGERSIKGVVANQST